MSIVKSTERKASVPSVRIQERPLKSLGVMMATFLAGGCISIDAPSEPIVLELNINITQEVIYRLASDVQNNIDQNPEIF